MNNYQESKLKEFGRLVEIGTANFPDNLDKLRVVIEMVLGDEVVDEKTKNEYKKEMIKISRADASSRISDSILAMLKKGDWKYLSMIKDRIFRAAYFREAVSSGCFNSRSGNGVFNLIVDELQCKGLVMVSANKIKLKK